MKLILFDIDGTLLDSGGAGTWSLNLAFEEVLGIREAFKGISMAGKTDIQILKEGLAKHGMNSANGNIGLLCDSYVTHLRVQIENPRKNLKPGIREALDVFSTMDVQLGLLTGNIERGARIKLEPFGLNRYFPLGAFGDDHEDRNRLLPVAAERFGEFCGKRIEYGDCVVIGDTPRDVECARIHGARSIAVATGPYTYEELVETGAHMVLCTMAEMDYSSLS